MPIIPGQVRRSEREYATLPITLVKRAECFRKDDAAMMLDVSLFGMRVRTTLALDARDWVGVVAKGEFPHAIPAHVVWVRKDELSELTSAGIKFVPAFST